MLYVAYGSNTNLDQMEIRCPHSQIVGKSQIENYKLTCDHHLDVRRSQGAITPVVVWDIAPDDWDALDRYEGYPYYYIRTEVRINLNGESKTAIVYVMANTHNDRMALPTPEYYHTVKQGYIQNGIDIAPLEQALGEAYNYETQKYNQ